RLLNMHTGTIPRRLGSKGDLHHCPVHAVQRLRIRRASIGRVGVINAASVDLYRVGIAGAPECARRESVVQASVLVEEHVKIRLVGSDTLTKKLVCRTADGATLGLGGIREKPAMRNVMVRGELRT